MTPALLNIANVSKSFQKKRVGISRLFWITDSRESPEYSLIFFATSIFSCSDINNSNISSFNFLPADSEVIFNINNLRNTKEILSKTGSEEIKEA